MKFTPTRIPGVMIVDVEPIEDDRGAFARSWCRDEFRAHGLVADVAQCSVSYNRRRGTLRGMHFQAAPHAEAKLVRCTRGAIHDVALDLRAESPSFRQWVAVDLDDRGRRALYIPAGCAHGFQTLTDDTEVFYQITPAFVEGAGRGVRWNDPAFDIAWPVSDPILSDRDRRFPDFAS